MKTRLFRKKFKINNGYYVAVKNDKLELYCKSYSKESKYLLMSIFSRYEVFNLSYLGYSVCRFGGGYKIGCCYISDELLQAIREEFNYKVIF